MTLPQDDFMLLSFINTKLRDEYPSLDALCEDFDADRRDIERRLNALGYSYDETRNAFK